MRGTVHLIGIVLLVSGGIGWALLASLALKTLGKALGMEPVPVAVGTAINRQAALNASRAVERLPFVINR